MAYEKQTWVNGDVITAERLNHIEDGIENGDNGYECEDTTELLFEGTLNSQVVEGYDFGKSIIAISGKSSPAPSAIKVEYDGIVYTCDLNIYFYGAKQPGYMVFDFSEYPFQLTPSSDSWEIITSTAGIHSVRVSEITDTKISVSRCFKKAVLESTPKSLIPTPTNNGQILVTSYGSYVLRDMVTVKTAEYDYNYGTPKLSMSFKEIVNALKGGGYVIVTKKDSYERYYYTLNNSGFELEDRLTFMHSHLTDEGGNTVLIIETIRVDNSDTVTLTKKKVIVSD